MVANRKHAPGSNLLEVCKEVVTSGPTSLHSFAMPSAKSSRQNDSKGTGW